MLVETAKGLHEWRDAIRRRAVLEMESLGQDVTRAPVDLELDFFLARPASHYGTGRNEGMLRPSAPRYPAVNPDLDKLARAVLDALTGTVVHDDRQVVSLVCSKEYADLDDTPGVTVTVIPAAQ